MNVRFYIDTETGEPHLHGHRVTGNEAVNVPAPEPDSVFVITAYGLRGKPLAVYRRRRRGVR